MGDFDITKSRSSFFASLNKRKRLGLDSDSDSEAEDEKRAKVNTHSKKPESNTNSQATTDIKSSNGTNTQPNLPHDDHLASLSQQVQQEVQQIQELNLKQQQSGQSIALEEEEDWLKEVTGGGEPSRPTTNADLINLSSDEEEIEALESSVMEGLDPELQKLINNKSKVDHTQPNKIDLKIQYVNENTVDEKYRVLVEKLMKPIKIRVMDYEQFDKVLAVFCLKKKLKKDDALLVYKEDKVFLRATPSGLGMKSNEDYILHVYPRHAYEAKIQKEKDEREERFQKRREQESMMERLLSDEAEAPSSSAAVAEEQEQRMVIILRGKDGKDVNLRVKPATLLKTLIEHYAKVSNITNTQNIRLQFEGETLDNNQTVEDIGLEEEDLVDVVM
ncbi:hypothetical protein K501DRAFT_332646 [Backusella circina FSU 941]|nr:hypothetical protein K501DRAFT_332646 [Backusella circina FSU 941]